MRAPRPVHVALVVALLFSIPPAGFAVQYVRTYAAERAGRSIEGQMHAMRGVPWFKPEYRGFVRRLSQRLPEDAALLVEPSGQPDPNPGGRTRWFLYLSNDLFPRRVFVHDAKHASGTLVDYPEWIRTNLIELDTAGTGAGGFAADILREERAPALEAALDARGVRWKLTYPISTRFRVSELALYERVRVEGSPAEWVERDLEAFLAGEADL